MVEIEEKYKIYEKKFGFVNWLGFFTLYHKEIPIKFGQNDYDVHIQVNSEINGYIKC